MRDTRRSGALVLKSHLSTFSLLQGLGLRVLSLFWVVEIVRLYLSCDMPFPKQGCNITYSVLQTTQTK